MRLRRLDHVGIYVLIAGTYTPAAWSLMKAAWRRGTLVTVWGVAGFCGARVWFGGILPTWISTLIYLGMGWGGSSATGSWHGTWAIAGCGPCRWGESSTAWAAPMNLTQWPVLWPGVFSAHELFHFFVIAGTPATWRSCSAWSCRRGPRPAGSAADPWPLPDAPAHAPPGPASHCGRRWPPAWGDAGSGSRSSLARPCSAALTSRCKSAAKPGGPRARSRPRSSR